VADQVYKDKKHVKSAWVSKSKEESISEKPWGFEKSWAGFNGIHGKLVFIKAGNRTSLKYHNLKSEVLMLQKGKAEALVGDEMTLKDPLGHPFKKEIMVPGDSLLVQSFSPYRITAIEDCEIIEIGDNSSDRPIRIEDDFGRVADDGEEHNE
jgi:hypothetical protein